LLVNASREKHACEISIRSGATTQDPLYPEGHPKRIEHDSQRAAGDGIPPKKKKKNVAPYLLLKAELLCKCAIPWISR
jgi:hypothetical protein